MEVQKEKKPMEEKEIDEYIEKMKEEPFSGSYQIKKMIETIENKTDFYRKNDLLKVLWDRYDALLDKDFDDIFSSFKNK